MTPRLYDHPKNILRYLGVPTWHGVAIVNWACADIYKDIYYNGLQLIMLTGIGKSSARAPGSLTEYKYWAVQCLSLHEL